MTATVAVAWKLLSIFHLRQAGRKQRDGGRCPAADNEYYDYPLWSVALTAGQIEQRTPAMAPMGHVRVKHSHTHTTKNTLARTWAGAAINGTGTLALCVPSAPVCPLLSLLCASAKSQRLLLFSSDGFHVIIIDRGWAKEVHMFSVC